jgi:arabinan endo-1,5-alpha-L-arabinosidase
VKRFMLLAPLALATASCGSDDADPPASFTPTPAPTPTPSPSPSPSPSPTPTPSGALTLTGNIAPAHDPAILFDNGTYYLFTTGNNGDAEGLLALRTSTNLTDWTLRGGSYTAIPAWAKAAVPDTGGMWAPDIIKVGNQYRLYYSISAFGKNNSAIGLATADVIDPAAPATNWQDQGAVVQSSTSDDYNAIDPMVFTNGGKRMWMAFGSFWTGIKVIELDPATGKRLARDPAPRALASRPFPGAIEAPYVIRRNGYYYLFASFESCCQGVNSTYYTVVGRSSAPLGPYVDREGKAMLDGGGTVVLTNGQDDGSQFVGRGHVSVIRRGGTDYLVYHAYDRQRNGFPTLQIQRLEWDADGWPVAR